MTGDVLLQVTDLAVHFLLQKSSLLGKKSVVRAVDGVSFALRSGETLGIVGESGCGKSTLCRAVLRLIEPTRGQITWRGNSFGELSGENLRLERRNMQIIFQDPVASLDPRLNVRQIIEEPLLNFPSSLSTADRQAKISQTLLLVGGNKNWLSRYPHEFSGGQAQRIGIARALVLEPKLLVCDEPVSSLDVSVQAQIINLLMDLQARIGLSYLFISHNLAVVRHISHRVLVLYLGKIMEIAERDEFYRRPLHPYSQALIAAVPLPDPARERTKPRVIATGDPPSPLNPPSGCRFRKRCPKATAICAEQEPALLDYGNRHMAACHHVDGFSK